MTATHLSETQRAALRLIATGGVTRHLRRYSHDLHPRPVIALIDFGFVTVTPGAAEGGIADAVTITDAGRDVLSPAVVAA